MPAELQHPLPFGNALGDTDGPKPNASRDQELAALYHERIEPRIKRYFASRLRVSLRANDDSRQNQDALDLCSEAKVLVLQKLRADDTAADGNEIRDIDAYVTSIAGNVFNQFLRRKYPRRYSLRNQLRYLLTHHRELAMWKVDDDQWFCGHAASVGSKDTRPIELNEIEVGRLQAKISGSGARKLIGYVTALFDLLDRAAAFDDLVRFTCDFLRIEEPTEVVEPVDLPEFEISSGQATALSDVEDSELVRRVWHGVLSLPVSHRIALLMNYREDAGGDLLSMLPVMRVATVRQIAAELGFKAEDFARIWNELPWDDNRIAEHLRVTRQQVINLRQSARQMLRRSLNTKG